MFTVRIHPQPGEALTSFLRRFAKANRTDVLSLWRVVKQRKITSLRKTDLALFEFAPTNVFNMEQLSKATNVSKEKLLSMTFYFVLRTFSHSADIEHSRFLTGVVREHFHFCPQCLEEKPSFGRILWKIVDIDVCVDHGRRLFNQCPTCHNRIKEYDLEDASICPYCHHSLISYNDYRLDMGIQLLGQQGDLARIWLQLLSIREVSLSPSEVAARILFFLNEQHATFCREQIKERLDTAKSKLPSLLQCARGSSVQRRSVHMKTIVWTLNEYRIDAATFLYAEIPTEFHDSLMPAKNNIRIEGSCLSPWCDHFHQNISLVRKKANRSWKSECRKNSAVGYVCLECGCRWTISERGEVMADDYFMKGYDVLKDLLPSQITIEGLSRRTALHRSICRRILAYFHARGMFHCEETILEFDTELLQRFAIAIQTDTGLEAIGKWKCWNSTTHFLIYRYHPLMMKEMILHKWELPERRVNWNQCKQDLLSACERLMKKDQDITIEAVAQKIRVSPNTLRKWGGGALIKKKKVQQRTERLQQQKNDLYDRIHAFFNQKLQEKVWAKEIYDHLGVSASYLRKVVPEIQAYIHHMRIAHNQNLKM